MISPTTKAMRNEKDFNVPFPKRDNRTTIAAVGMDKSNVVGFAKLSIPGVPPKNSNRVKLDNEIPTIKITVPEITGVNKAFNFPITPVIDKIKKIIALRKIPPLAAARPFAFPAEIIIESKAAEGP